MYFLFLLLPVLLWGLHRIQARRQWWDGPNLRQQLRDWDEHSPAVKAARLPKIKPLRGVKETRWALLRRVR